MDNIQRDFAIKVERQNALLTRQIDFARDSHEAELWAEFLS